MWNASSPMGGSPVAEIGAPSPAYCGGHGGAVRRRAAAVPAPGPALFSSFVDGEPVPVPATIDIDEGAGIISPLHAHAPHGVINREAAEPAPFTLGQVFDIWGVALGSGRLGGFTDAGERRVRWS